MRKRDHAVLIGCGIILMGLIVLTPKYGWAVRSWLSSGISNGAAASGSDLGLAAENETLKAQLAELQAVASELPEDPQGDIRAMVYSRYPLNFKNELLVSAGAGDGVAAGDAVLFQGIVIGSVEQVFSGSALVQTVFDGGFKTPVRIGSGGYDALFTGGAYPEATSIQKNAPIAPGDIVYAAAPGFPYGAPIAVITATSTSPDNLFETASLSFAYDVNNVETVLIAK